MKNIEIELNVHPAPSVEKAIAAELTLKDKPIKDILDKEDDPDETNTRDIKTNTEDS